MKRSLTSIKARNFRGFLDNEFSFAATAKENKGLIVVYGQNGSGKSSLASLFEVLASLTLMVQIRIGFSNALANFPTSEPIDAYRKYVRPYFVTNMQDLIEENKTLGSNGQTMELEYHFQLNDKKGIYRIVTDDEKCVEEELSFRLDSRIETLFRASKTELHLNSKSFLTSAVRSLLKEEHNRLFGSSPFLSILYNFAFDSNPEYFAKNCHEDIATILSFCAGLNTKVTGNNRELVRLSNAQHALVDLQGKKVDEYLEKSRPALELGLTVFFTSLSYDIDSVNYQKIRDSEGEKYHLFFNERHGKQNIRPIPVEHLSTGTRKLIGLFFSLYNAMLGNVTVIDEVDTGIHDLIIANVLKATQECEMGQLIFTTHNTLLMRQLPKSSIYFLDEDEGGKVTFYSLADFGRQVQEKTDVVGRYINGLYGGAPFPEVPSMRVIKEMMEEKMEEGGIINAA